jgi:hypothetical protein
MRTLRLATLVAALGLVVLATGGSLASGSTNVLVNGDFETGSMSGWGHAPGHPLRTSHGWFAYHGDVAPLSGAPVPPPPQGRTAALADQTGPGGNVLFQTFRVPKSGQLSMTLWYVNWAGVFFTPRMLVPGPAPDQQLRIDLTLPNAGLYSLRPSDIVANVFRTVPGDPVAVSPHTITFNLAPLAGRLVRLRIAEVDNEFFFTAGVDSVQVTGSGALTQVPLRSARIPAKALRRPVRLYRRIF